MANQTHFSPSSPASTERRKVTRIRSIAALLVGTAVMSGCDYQFGMPDPVTEQGKDIMQLWQVSMWAAIALGIIVFGVLGYSMIRHRRRNNLLPKQTEGNVALEVTYTIIPFLIVGALFYYGYVVQQDAVSLEKEPEAAAAANELVRVDVTGYQWNWRFDYIDQDVSVIADNVTPPELVLPANKTIRFNLMAADVNHSFFVPGFLTKRDMIPGVRNEIEVTPNQPGEYAGFCAEYCGLQHSDMDFRVRIVPEAEYDQWIAQQQVNEVTPA